MVFMLKMLGIEATNIHCHDNRSDINGSNHSMVRVSFSDGYVYSDPSIWVSMPNASELSKKFICTDYDFISNYVTLDHMNTLYLKIILDIHIINRRNIC